MVVMWYRATFQHTVFHSRTNSSNSLNSTEATQNDCVEPHEEIHPQIFTTAVVGGARDIQATEDVTQAESGDDMSSTARGRVVRRVVGPKTEDDEVPMTSAPGVETRLGENVQDHL